MKLEDIEEYYQTGEFVEANKKLQEGFVTVRISPSRIKTNDYEMTGVLFVMARIKGAKNG
jgi:hypothetical protein